MKLALALLLLLTAPAFAWNEPNSIGGVPWGATQEELRVQLRQAGDTVRCDAPQLCISTRASFGPVPVTITYLFPRDGKFEMALVTFKSADYRALRGFFYAQCGAPKSSRVEKFQSRATWAQPTNEIAEWSGEHVLIELRRHASKVDEGRALIMLEAVRDREGDAEAAGAQKEQG